MTMPSSIAATTLALQKLLQTAMTPLVNVTTLTPALAENFVATPKSPARVNLALLGIAESLGVRNNPRLPQRSGQRGTFAVALDLRYMVTVYGKAQPTAEHSVERLLEAALQAFMQHPILSQAELQAAMPGNTSLASASIALDDSPPSEKLNLFSGCQAQWRPSLTYIVRTVPV